MNRLMSRLFGTFILAAMLVFVTGTAYSQTDTTENNRMNRQSDAYQNAKYDKDVADAASILRTRVDLTMEQTTRVEGILQNFKDNSSRSTTAGNDDTLDKISNVLTADQKTKFENVKTQWWTETQRKLGGTSMQNDNSGSGIDTTRQQ